MHDQSKGYKTKKSIKFVGLLIHKKGTEGVRGLDGFGGDAVGVPRKSVCITYLSLCASVTCPCISKCKEMARNFPWECLINPTVV